MSCGLDGAEVRVYEASKQGSTTGKTDKNDRGSNATQSEKEVVGLEIGTHGRGRAIVRARGGSERNAKRELGVWCLEWANLYSHVQRQGDEK